MDRNLLLAVGLLIGGAGYLTLAWSVWRRRTMPAATSLLVTIMGIAIWTIAYAMEMTTTTYDAAEVWSTIKYLGIVLVPGSLLAFAIQYTERGRRLTRGAFGLLALEPLIVMIILVVPPLRDLMLYYDPNEAQAHTKWPVPSGTPLFQAHLVYSYVVLLIGLSLLSVRMLRLGKPYRQPTLLVVLSSVTALAGNALYNLAFEHVPIDPTPLLFTVLMGVLVWGLFRLGLIDLMPFARSVVIDQLTDAVLVLDAYNRVLDANPAATGLLGVRRRDLVGRSADNLLPPVAPLLDHHTYGAEQQEEIEASAHELGRAGTATVHLEAGLSSLLDREGRELGRVLVLRDITQRTETERRLREMLDAETQLASVLQTSLRPAVLPSVPGVHLAARSLPSGHGNRVSGDFYDVHQALGGDWAMVLGDVAGKGVHAAVVTSMVRYTVRSLSAQGYTPRQVVEQLNQALLVDTGPESFCTMVYARLGRRYEIGADGLEGDPLPGRRITLTLSGHPPPLVRRLDGSIEAVGRPGTALGVVSLLDNEVSRIDLLPGEVLLAYTDGVTEARRDRVEFGEERLAWILASAASGLRGRAGPAAAALVAEAVADRVMEAVTEFAPSRDDIAVLVLAVD